MADDPEIDPQKTEHKNNPSSDNSKVTPQTLRAELEIPQPIIDEYHTEKDKKDRRDRNRLRIEVATLIVIFLYTSIAAYQGCQMRKATKAAKKSADAATSAAKTAKATLDQNKKAAVDTLNEMIKQSKTMRESAISTKETVKQSKASLDATIEHFRLEQRAWVGPVEVSPAEYAEGDKKVYVKEGQKIKGGIRFVNSGKTPALNVRNAYGFRYLKSGIAPSVTLKATEMPPGSTTIMQPGMSGYLYPTPIPLERVISKTDIDDIINERVIVYIIGIITYDDIFKRNHSSKFCLRLKSDLTTFESCTTNNEID